MIFHDLLKRFFAFCLPQSRLSLSMVHRQMRGFGSVSSARRMVLSETRFSTFGITDRFLRKISRRAVRCSRSGYRWPAADQLRRDAGSRVALASQQGGNVGFPLIFVKERPRLGPMLTAAMPMEDPMLRWGKTLIALALMMAMPVAVSAQTADKPPQPQPHPGGRTPPSAELLKPEQLEALVAPIALYPDELLANVLAASTYPLEVVQADRWVKARKTSKGDALKKEVEKQSWDDSVKALASTADVISMMSDKIDWTKNLGDAVLAQQTDVMDAIQPLRSKAYDSKKLVTTKQQKVSLQTQDSKQAIVIESADPNTIYVPYYDPAAVYGAWPYAEYPPYYFGYPSYIAAGVIAAALALGAGWAIGRWGDYWGGGCNWGNRNVYVNHRTTNIGNGWQHNPAHRQGVRYNNANAQQRFGNSNLNAGAADRMDFRGRDGQQVLRPNQDRPGAGDRAGDRV